RGQLSPLARLRPRPRASSTVLAAYADPGTSQNGERGRDSLLSRRGGRAVECGGLENRFGPLGPTRVQIPPPPLRPSAVAPGGAPARVRAARGGRRKPRSGRGERSRPRPC